MILIVFSIFVTAANAEEPYDIISCYSGEVTTLSSNTDLTILSYDLKGVSRSNTQGGAFDNWSCHIIGLVRIELGKPRQNDYYGKYMSPEGDFIIGVGKGFGDEGTWEFIQGTGKWKGITGGGKNRSIRIKSIKEGTMQGCSVATGTYELPK